MTNSVVYNQNGYPVTRLTNFTCYPVIDFWIKKYLNIEDTITSGEFEKKKAQELKQNCRGKKMYGHFVREMPEKVDKDKLGNGYPKVI